MAGPLAGIGQQQVPLSTTLQPGGANNGAQQQVRQNDEQTPTPQQTNEVRPQGAPTNETQQSNAESNNERFAASEVSASDDSGDQRRGSLIDIQV